MNINAGFICNYLKKLLLIITIILCQNYDFNRIVCQSYSSVVYRRFVRPALQLLKENLNDGKGSRASVYNLLYRLFK